MNAILNRVPTLSCTGVPLRAGGKVNLNVNGVHLSNQDLQVYIVPTDGRVYAAISKIPQSIGSSLQVIYPVTAMLNWLFAIPTSNGLNGFQITGENRSKIVVHVSIIDTSVRSVR